MPVDVLLDLTLNTGNLVVLEAFAALTHSVLLPAAPSSPSSPETIAATSAAVMSETADVLRSTAKALKDNKITPRERREITLQVQQTITACVKLLTTLKDHGDC